MTAIDRSALTFVDDYRFPALPDFAADGGLDLQLVAWLQAERQIVSRGAGDPSVFGDARATAVNPMPVVLPITSRMVETTAMPLILLIP